MSDERHHGRQPPERAERDLSGQNLSEPPLPESVGPYRIVDRIGAGGMGVVYRARDERLERWVAIKHIRPGEADLRSRERLRREARTVAGLSHPSIVQVHDIVETREGDWIVMELVQGKTLKDLVEENGLEMIQVLQLAREIAEGLAEAHAKGVVHRDLKTENVKVTELGHAKILDFGLAKRVWHGSKEESLSVQGAILGTGRAMSPEQALGEEVNHLSDLFSFGTLLFETVTRRPPFVGSSLILTMAQICTEDQPSARDLNPETPRELSALIDHLLQKDPLQRPQSAGEVVEALQRIAARMASRRVTDEADDPSDTAVAPAVPPAPPAAVRPSPAVARLPSRSSGMRPVTMSRSSESTAGIFIKTLVETSLVGGERLGDRFGDADAYELFSRHDRLARDVLAEHDGFEIHRTDEGFLFLFERPVDAVEFVLAYQRSLAEFSVEVGLELEMRSAIHLSEIYLRENTPEEIHRGAKPFEVEGLAKLVVSRVMALGRGGQTLLTQEAYDMTRRALVGHPLATRKLHWRAHGPYLFSGVDEAVRIFEVAAESIAASGRLLESADAQRLSEEHGAPKLRRHDRRRKLLLAAAALAGVIGASAILRLGMEEPPEPAPAPSAQSQPQPAPPSLAVLGFRNLTGNENDDWLSTALAELLAAELGGGADLRLVPGEIVSRAKKRERSLLENETLAPDTLQQLRDDLGSEYVILGSYLSLGEEKRLTVQMKLQDTAKGETVAMVQQAGTELELPDLVSRISREVREKMGLSPLSPDRSRTLRASLSPHNEANRYFYEGLERFRSFDLVGARDDFLEAIRLDPSFAMANADLSRTWLMLGYDAKAAEAGRRAYELAQDLPREGFLWIEGIYYESIGDLKAAINTHRALWRVYPDELKYGLRLAELQISASQGDEALATLAELRKLPAPSCEDPRIDLAEAQAAMVNWKLAQVVDAADRVIANGRRRSNSTLMAEAHRLRGRALVGLGRSDEAAAALEVAQRLFRDSGDVLGLGKTLFSFAYLEQGKRNPSRAEQLLREALEIFEKTGSRKSILHAQHGLAYMIQQKGELKAARQLLEEAHQTARDIGSIEDEAWTLDTLSLVLYQSGELIRAERMLRDLIKICREHNNRRTEYWATVNLGLTLYAAGKLAEARTLFAAISNTEDTGDRPVALALNGLGTVYYSMDDLAQAERYFEQYSKIQSASGEWGEQALTEPLHAATLLELGRLEEARTVALQTAQRFHDAELVLYEAAALRMAAEALWRQGRVEEARAQLDEALRLGGDSENPDVRLRLELTVVRFLAADNPREAVRRLRPIIGEATRLNLKPVELEALLALGRIELRLDASSVEVARARLEALGKEAARRDFKLVARHARESLEAIATGAAASSAP